MSVPVSWLGADVSIEPGTLYVVATPIGNLGDISQRALAVLAGVDCIAAEDTRHTARLLGHFGIGTPQVSLHEHNEEERSAELRRRLQAGESVALVSDAGTPLISDPGYRLVREVRGAGLAVVPVPGPSALIAALSVSGLPTDRFAFEGFPAPKAAARRRQFEALREEPRTLVFYESSHRVAASLEDMRAAFGAAREAVIARELTKAYEQVQAGTLAELVDWLAADANRERGEFVIMVAGHRVAAGEVDEAEARRVLGLLLEELPVKAAARLAAELLDQPRNALYALALSLKESGR
ncbi:MAG: 16S rRNA (cytidine(1402)-2'-O)-methyltransferase [Chromatiales bacterium]|nr:16S rRNA (cytidine(1402)-2'-O)-methyltransferase [Chromatiales bacterium]